MSRLQIAMAREIAGWPLYTIVMAFGQVLSATSFQITLLSGVNSQDNLRLQAGQGFSLQTKLLSGGSPQDSLQLYVLSAVFLAASAMWYPIFRLKPSIWVLSTPWLFFGLAFFFIGLPSLTQDTHPAYSSAMSILASLCYAIASGAAFLFFGLNFGEEAVSVSLPS